MVPGRGAQGRHGRLRPGEGLHDHQALRLRRVGEHAARHGPAHQGDRPRQRLLPAVRPEEPARAGEGARRGLLARVRVGDDRRRGRARGAARDPADLRGDHLLDLREVGAVLARPAGAHQPVGERRPLGEGDAALPAHDRVPLAGGPHPPRHRRGGAGRDAQDARRLPGLLRGDAGHAGALSARRRRARSSRGRCGPTRSRRSWATAGRCRRGPATTSASTSPRPTASSSWTRTRSGRSRGPPRGGPRPA